MLEMGEGMPRIFRAMKDSDLVEPELISDDSSFSIVLSHQSIFTRQDQEWLKAFGAFPLSRDEQRVLLLGRDGHLVTPNEVIRSLEIIDTEDYRKIVDGLQRKGLLVNALSRQEIKRLTSGRRRDAGRYAVRPPAEAERFLNELLLATIPLIGGGVFGAEEQATLREGISNDSPYHRAPKSSLVQLGFLDEHLSPTDELRELAAARQPPS